MTRLPNLLPHAAALLACGAFLAAQSPENPPPWWGVHDNVTVSLYWSFSGPQPLRPLEVAVPSWYNSTVTRAQVTGPLQVRPNLNGHTDVLALSGTGTPLSASLAVTVDNDPHYNWVKVFWFEFDEFEGASSSVVEALKQDLTKYKRSSMTTSSKPIGNGWNRVTVQAQLIPQPDDEEIDFSFFTQAVGDAAIDDLYVNSKCVKLDETDQDGDAFGTPDGFTVDLQSATGAPLCLAAAVTEGPGPSFQRTYWVSALGTLPGAPHQIFQLNQSGSAIAVTPLPDTLATVPNGASDLAVETIVSSGGTPQQIVYALVDLRNTPGGHVRLRAIDSTGVLNPTADIDLVGFPTTSTVPQGRFGLALNPAGNQGLGTFLVTVPGTAPAQSLALEFDRTGSLLRSVPGLPSGVVGAGYDRVFGNYYFFSNSPRATPTGPVQVNGSEWSGYDMTPTGTTFFGNLNLPNPGGPRGGVASGFDVYRRSNGEFRGVCVAQVNNRSVMYELRGPFRFGASLHGVCGLLGLPMAGSNTMALTLSGVPHAAFAMLYAGFARQQSPIPLGTYGLDETNVLITLDMNGTLQTPTATGDFVFPMPTLPTGFANVPMFFQWVVFDPTVPVGVAMSQAGKTLIY